MADHPLTTSVVDRTSSPGAPSTGAQAEILRHGFDEVTVMCRGDLDCATRPLLEAALGEADGAHPERIIVDLTHATFFDMSVVGAVVRAREQCRRTGRQLLVRSTSPCSRKLFSLVDLDDLLEEPSPDEPDPTAPTSPVSPRRLGDLSHRLIEEVALPETVRSVCEEAVLVVPAAQAAAVAMWDGGRLLSIGSSGESVAALDRWQCDMGEGPTIAAGEGSREVAFCSFAGSGGPLELLARTHGIGGAMAVPLTAAGATVGVLTFYATAPGTFATADHHAAKPFADHVAYILANTKAYWDAHELSENLARALGARAVIEQAKGIIMATSGGTPEAAFDQLLRQSQHEDVKLRDVAASIVRLARRR